MDRPTLVFATHNPGKLAEMRALLAPFGLACRGAESLGLPSPEEVGETFAENAAIKARAAFAACGLPALADDSGLVVRALGGAPGVHTSRFAAGELGFGAAIERLGGMMAALGEEADPGAELVCALCLVTTGGEARASEARAEGRVVFPPRGEGPGFEPIFEPRGQRRTLAEMGARERLLAHPRTAAVAALGAELRALSAR